MPKEDETPTNVSTESNEEVAETAASESDNKDESNATSSEATPKVESEITPKPNDGELIPRDQLDAIVSKAVQAALTENQEKQEAEAKRKAAEENGNYQELYQEELRLRKVEQLNNWRGAALRKHKLDDEWFDSLSGATEEEINESAKSLRKRLDKVVADEKKASENAHPGTPQGGRGNQQRPTANDGKDKTSSALAGAFGVSNLNRK